jgi:3-oxoacyl-[acyl-carrier-protein] synthase III
MSQMIRTLITGTGSYIPTNKVTNEDFLNYSFYDRNGKPFEKENREIVEKFGEITGISERRYVTDDLLASDIGTLAAKKAIESSGIDPESLDYIIVAHNFGDVRSDNLRVDLLPSLASRIKKQLAIKNPYCIAYDLPFGCPGWLQGVIQSDYFIKSGDAKAALVIGTETLSRVCDPHDRDSMIYADGAGATVLEGKETSEKTGLLSHVTRTDTESQAFYLTMGKSYNFNCDDTLYLKMEGRKLYHYALSNVPGVVKASLDKAGLSIDEIKKVLIHQANEKMDEAILKRIFELYGKDDPTPCIMPMTISKLGNTSVATVPTMLDLILRGKLDGHQINSGDHIILASVGAGMNINSVVYRMG